MADASPFGIEDRARYFLTPAYLGLPDESLPSAVVHRFTFLDRNASLATLARLLDLFEFRTMSGKVEDDVFRTECISLFKSPTREIAAGRLLADPHAQVTGSQGVASLLKAATMATLQRHYQNVDDVLEEVGRSLVQFQSYEGQYPPDELAVYMARSAAFYDVEEFRHLIARYWNLLVRSATAKDFAYEGNLRDLDAVLSNQFGIGLIRFFSLAVGVLVHAHHREPIRSSLNTAWVDLRRLFSAIYVSDEELANFSRLFVAHIEEVREAVKLQYREMLHDPHDSHAFFWDFKPFWKRPVIRFEDNSCFIPSTRWAVERATNGLRHVFIEVGDWNAIDASLTDDYLDYFGHLFQWHVTTSFKRMFGEGWDSLDSASDVAYKVGKNRLQSPDVVFLLGDTLYVFEVSARELTLTERVSGDPARFLQELQKKTTQMDSRLRELAAGYFAVGRKTFADVGRVCPCIVVPSQPPFIPVPKHAPADFVPPLMRFERQVAEHHLFEDESLAGKVLPVQVLSCADIEAMEGLAVKHACSPNFIRRMFADVVAGRATDIARRHASTIRSMLASERYKDAEPSPYMQGCFEEAFNTVGRELLGEPPGGMEAL